MPFIPHTDTEVQEMLAVIGVGSVEDLFDEIPPGLLCGPLAQVPEGMGELEVGRWSRARLSGRARVAALGLGHNLWPRLFFFAAGFGALIVMRGLADVAARVGGARGPTLARPAGPAGPADPAGPEHRA